jgi:small subunit ribosomal protein S6
LIIDLIYEEDWYSKSDFLIKENDSLSESGIRTTEPKGGRKLKRYETLFIALPEMSADDIGAIADRYTGIITNMKGSIIKVNKWGKRKLAYPIRKQSKGYYILIDYAGASQVVAELERNLKFDDKILKYMTIKNADKITPEEIEKEIAGPQKEDAAPAPGAEIKPPEPVTKEVEAAAEPPAEAEKEKRPRRSTKKETTGGEE